MIVGLSTSRRGNWMNVGVVVGIVDKHTLTTRRTEVTVLIVTVLDAIDAHFDASRHFYRVADTVLILTLARTKRPRPRKPIS